MSQVYVLYGYGISCAIKQVVEAGEDDEPGKCEAPNLCVASWHFPCLVTLSQYHETMHHYDSLSVSMFIGDQLCFNGLKARVGVFVVGWN